MTDEELERTLRDCENIAQSNKAGTTSYPDNNLLSEIDKILAEEMGTETPQPTVQKAVPKEKPVMKEILPIKPQPHKTKYKPVEMEVKTPPVSKVPVNKNIVNDEDTKDLRIAFKPAEGIKNRDYVELDDSDLDIPKPDRDEAPGMISRVFRTTCSLMLCVVIAFVLSFLITHFVAHHTEVEGSSMEATLHNEDQIIVENVSYYISDPKRYDVVVFPYSDGVNYIKRVIGLPGETVQIKEGKVYINGSALKDDTYGKEAMQDAGLAAEPIKLGYDEYFVLGDNRNASIDSRKEAVGVVHKGEISGKAWLRFYPFSDFGSIK